MSPTIPLWFWILVPNFFQFFSWISFFFSLFFFHQKTFWSLIGTTNVLFCFRCEVWTNSFFFFFFWGGGVIKSYFEKELIISDYQKKKKNSEPMILRLYIWKLRNLIKVCARCGEQRDAHRDFISWAVSWVP